ncbi:hypothetical protein [Paraburkholderia tuberum]|uniref:hypothetical protein n=1 Tax=Paraburkholderia tuberum TaxID=157910 RepID=UPI000B87F6CA|nr:hypothetical protein [Paraburkholderia tuberum]
MPFFLFAVGLQGVCVLFVQNLAVSPGEPHPARLSVCASDAPSSILQVVEKSGHFREKLQVLHEKDAYPYKLSLRDLVEMMAGRGLSLLPLSGMPSCSIDKVSIPIGKISA